MMGPPMGAPSEVPRSIPAELRPGPSPDLYGPDNRMMETERDIHVAEPGTTPPAADMLNPENEAPDIPVPGSESEPAPSPFPTPKGFEDYQWAALSPPEQEQYHSLNTQLSDAIDRHDHNALKDLAGQIAGLQQKMKQAQPPQPMMPMPPELLIEGQDPNQPVPAQPPPMPPEQRRTLTFKGIRTAINPEKLEPVEKAVRTSHASAHNRRPSASHKYIRRWLKGNTWHYEYATEKHANDKQHGVGENAVRAMGQKQEHTIDLHPELSHDLPADKAYASTVRRADPKDLTWTAPGKDGATHVYRQNADKQSEVWHQKHDEAPKDPHGLEMDRKDRITLNTYHKKHVGRWHAVEGQPGVDDRNVYKDKSGNVVGTVQHNPNVQARPWEVHEPAGKKTFTAGKKQDYERFENEGAARRFIEFYRRFSSSGDTPDKAANVFEDVKATSELDGKKFPVSKKLEEGKIPYVSRQITDPNTGEQYLAMIPSLKPHEQRQLLQREMGDVIRTSVDYFLRRNNVIATQQLKDAMAATAIGAAWDAMIVKQGGRRTGGFTPGVPGQGLLPLIRATLRAPNGPLSQELSRADMVDVTEDNEKTIKDYQERELGGGIAVGRAYLSAEDWKKGYLKDWRKEQMALWRSTQALDKNNADRQRVANKVAEELQAVDSRTAASRFARKYAWAKHPEVRQVVRGELVMERTPTPQQAYFFKEMVQTMKEVGKDLAEDDSKKAKFYDHMVEELRGGAGNELQSLMMPHMEKIWPDMHPWGRELQFMNLVREFQGDKRIRAMRKSITEITLREVIDKIPEASRVNHPAYRAALSYLIKGRIDDMLVRVVDDIAPESGSHKRKVLTAVIKSITNHRRVPATIQELAENKPGSLEQIRNWYKEARQHPLFKSAVNYLIAAEVSNGADNLRKLANRSAMEYFN